ncbi:uncharacterized protein [Hetaerina americana]|uniref:uncharacterized protein isoform X2 n=1 Tax=Hetaerina americana TaxID=62018 RepID=UPI003A7F35A8
MAVPSSMCYSVDAQIKAQDILETFVILNEEALNSGFTVKKIRESYAKCKSRRLSDENNGKPWHSSGVSLCILATAVFTILLVVLLPQTLTTQRCLLQNNFFVMEATRPLTDCGKVCKGVDSVLILDNTTKEEFSKLAYLSRPILVRGGANHWPAIRIFSFEFFRRLYEGAGDNDSANARRESYYQSVEEECQFFPFRTDFVSLREVFAMSKERANFSDGQRPWYIGWSNCHPEVANILRQHYQRPHFLPESSEVSAIDWVFMGGYGVGASIHLDYVSRPSWQAQISGSKTWKLIPPPECEGVCTAFSITVNAGDIVISGSIRVSTSNFIIRYLPTPTGILLIPSLFNGGPSLCYTRVERGRS